VCHSGPRKPAFPRAAKQRDTGSLQHAAAAGGASAGLRRRARPGEVRFASAGKGTGTHIAVEKLNRDLHITALHTPPGATDAITDVIEGTAAGRTAYAMVPIPTATPHIQDGGLVALGVSTVRRSRLLPDVPPLAEAGAEGFDFPIWYGIWAPARNPHEIVSKLARDISNALATAELLDWLNRHDADPMRMTQTEFAAFVESECERANAAAVLRLSATAGSSASGPCSALHRWALVDSFLSRKRSAGPVPRDRSRKAGSGPAARHPPTAARRPPVGASLRPRERAICPSRKGIPQPPGGTAPAVPPLAGGVRPVGH